MENTTDFIAIFLFVIIGAIYVVISSISMYEFSKGREELKKRRPNQK